MRCRSVTFAWPWDGCGGGCLSAVARKPVYPGLRWSAEWLAGSRKLTFVILIPGSALALLPKARAGCSNAARPDPWRGLWATMIPTPTSVQTVRARNRRGVGSRRVRVCRNIFRCLRGVYVRASDFDFGGFFLKQKGYGVCRLVAPAALDGLDKTLFSDVRQRQRNIELAPKRRRETDVFTQQIEWKCFGFEIVAKDRLRHLYVQHMHAPDHAAANAFPKRFGFYAGLDAERKSFRDRLRNRVVHHLVDELADAAAAQWTGVQHLIAESAQDRCDPIEDFFLAADHDFVDTARGSRLAGGDGSVEYESALCAKERFKLSDQ